MAGEEQVLSLTTATSCENITDKIDMNFRGNDNNCASSEKEEHWQTFRETIRERNSYMFNNSLMSDVSFSISKVTDAELKQSIPAHKYVLAISSPVFYAMFYGRLAEEGDTVEITDSNYECFVEFLRFLYCDEAELSVDCVMGVNYLAKKYIVPALEKKCTAFIEESIQANNVFKLLSTAKKCNDESVEKICWEFLDTETTEALNAPSLCEVEQEIVQELLTRDTLHAKEIDLFLAVKKWSAHNNQQENDDGQLNENIRDIVNLIRYPLMSQREFAEHVAKSKLLRHEDVINMFLKFNDTLEDDSVIPFSQVPRRGYYRCSFYKHVYDTLGIDTWDPETSKTPNTLTFSSNSNILLCGVGLYGSDNNNDSYSFQVLVYDEDDTMLLQSEGTFSCYAQCYAYDVIFNKPVKVQKNIWYVIQATVDGPRGVFGGQPVAKATSLEADTDEISCGPVRFLFRDLRPSGNQVHEMYNHFSGLLYFLR